MRPWHFGLIALTALAMNSSKAQAQNSQQFIGPFMDFMGRMIDEAARQQELERLRNSPEVQIQEIQPGGLTRGQVIILQQTLLQRGYDVGPPDGIVGPRTMAVVGQLQAKAGVPITGLPSKDLLDALLQ
jgi:hypothetical protein